MSSNNSARFLREFLAQPMATGAIVPSSEVLGRAVVRNLDLSNAKAVVEYGPGTGAFTTYVLQALDHDADFLAIEINPRLAFGLRGGSFAVELQCKEGLRVVGRQHGPLPGQAVALQTRVVGAGLPGVANASGKIAGALMQLERGAVHIAFKPYFHDSSEADRAGAKVAVLKRLNIIANRMRGPYLFGDRFSTADAYLFVMLRWAKNHDIELPRPLADLFDRVSAREAVRQAIGEEEPVAPLVAA